MLDTPGTISEARVGFDNLENGRFDSSHLPIDLFEALSVLTFQQRERQNLSAVLGGGSILHQGLASDVKLLQFEQDLACRRARLQFQQGAHASQDRRIQAIGLRQLAGRLSEAARLTRIDLDERNASDAQRAFDGAMIGPGRFEHGHRQVNGTSGERRRVLVQMGVRRRRLCWRSGARQQSRSHAKRGGLQPLQILDKGCERGSRLDREPTGTIAPAGLT